MIWFLEVLGVEVLCGIALIYDIGEDIWVFD